MANDEQIDEATAYFDDARRKVRRIGLAIALIATATVGFLLAPLLDHAMAGGETVLGYARVAIVVFGAVALGRLQGPFKRALAASARAEMALVDREIVTEIAALGPRGARADAR